MIVSSRIERVLSMEKQNTNIDFDTEKLTIGEGVPFERIRRITGYLAGDVRFFNNAKRAEERDRVKHGTEKEGL